MDSNWYVYHVNLLVCAPTRYRPKTVCDILDHLWIEADGV